MLETPENLLINNHILIMNQNRLYHLNYEYFYHTFPGLKLRVRIENLIFLFLNQIICCGYSKEPSQ